MVTGSHHEYHIHQETKILRFKEHTVIHRMHSITTYKQSEEKFLEDLLPPSTKSRRRTFGRSCYHLYILMFRTYYTFESICGVLMSWNEEQ